MLIMAGIANLARRRPVGDIPNGLSVFAELDWFFKIDDLFLL